MVLILSVIGTHTFDGYALLEAAVGSTGGQQYASQGYPPNMKMKPARMHLVRRGVIPFQQVAHIRDSTGLQGRPVSSAKDGMRLGLPAGRALCRAIDKRAFKDDPVHYSDSRYLPNVLPDSSGISTLRCKPSDLELLHMSYDAYRDWYGSSRASDSAAPSLSQIFTRK